MFVSKVTRHLGELQRLNGKNVKVAMSDFLIFFFTSLERAAQQNKGATVWETFHSLKTTSDKTKLLNCYIFKLVLKVFTHRE